MNGGSRLTQDPGFLSASLREQDLCVTTAASRLTGPPQDEEAAGPLGQCSGVAEIFTGQLVSALPSTPAGIRVCRFVVIHVQVFELECRQKMTRLRGIHVLKLKEMMR